MYLFVKFEGVVKVISNVTVDEDCCPVVDGKPVSDSPDLGESSVVRRSNVDAISWFKSLPMEAVYIDCSARDARWCPKSVTVQDSSIPALTPTRVSVHLRKKSEKPSRTVVIVSNGEEELPFMPESARPLFSEHPGVVDFNPVIDEMFERAENVVRKWDTLAGQGELNREIAKILHCYVFPAVSFQNDDVPVLQECLRITVLKQKSIEREIVDTEKDVSVTEKYLNKQRDVILNTEGLGMQSYLQACDDEFVKMFYIHVTKDCQRKNMKLDNMQLKVNDLKKSGQDQDKLESLLKERDAVHEMVNKLIVVREAIRNHLYRPFIPKKKRGRKFKISKGDASLHLVFKTVHQQLVEHKDRLKKLCYRKLYTVSVKEAIETTIKMVQQESPRALGDFSEFSVYFGRNTDVKHWKSMQAKVDEWLATDSPLMKSHRDGCQLVKDLADSILSDSQIASMGLEDSESIEVTGAALGNDPFALEMSTRKMMPGSVALLSGAVNETDMGEDLLCRRAPMVKVMKDQVLVHTWEMAEQVVNQMNFKIFPGSRHINRAWVCYSPHFWLEAGEAVERIYTHFHASQARKVYHLLRSVTLSDIMDSKMFHEVFVQSAPRLSASSVDSTRESSAAIHIPPADTVSAVSLDLMRCSLTDLYARVNRDGAKLNCQMLDLESIRSSFESTASHISLDISDLNKMCSGSETGSAVPHADADSAQGDQPLRRSSSESDSGDSVHSEDLFETVDTEGSDTDAQRAKTEADRSSETLVSVLTLFEAVVEPYHELVQKVLEAPDIMEKLRAVWKSVDFLCQKTGEICKARGMDSLLPFSIFATSSFPEDLFVKYYIQLLILTDLKPPFVFHSMYDFSLTNAISTYMYLFEARLPSAVPSSDESDT